MNRTTLAAFVVAAALPAVLSVCGVGAAARSAAPDERVQVGLPGRNDTADFSPALDVTLDRPNDYRRVSFDGDSGDWRGPPVMQNGRATTLQSSISWGVAFRKDVRSADQAAKAGLIQGYAPRQAAAIQLPHVVAGRRVGTVPGSLLLTQSAARVEAALGFPLGRGAFAVVEFAALFPDSDNVPPNVNRVKDKLASTWNRDEVAATLRGVALDGSLPPARVLISTASRHVVLGRVVDSFGHPVAGATARLQVRAGRSWRATGASIRTDGAGRYSLHVRGHGLFRVAGSLRRAGRFAAPVSAYSRAFRGGR